MAGERAALMATDPPYLVDYDGGNHPQTWGQRRPTLRGEDKHWDAYTDPESAAPSTRTSWVPPSRGALTELPPSTSGLASCAPTSSGGLARGRLLPHQRSSGEEPPGARRARDFMCDYEPMPVRLAARASMPAAQAAGQRARRLGDRHREASRTAPRASHPTMKPVETRAPPDRLPHRARRADLRALLGLRHGHHRLRRSVAAACA